MRTVFDTTFSKSSDVQEGEFVFFEINKFTYLVHSLKTITATAVSCSKVSERQGSVRKTHWKVGNQLGSIIFFANDLK